MLSHYAVDEDSGFQSGSETVTKGMQDNMDIALLHVLLSSSASEEEVEDSSEIETMTFLSDLCYLYKVSSYSYCSVLLYVPGTMEE